MLKACLAYYVKGCCCDNNNTWNGVPQRVLYDVVWYGWCVPRGGGVEGINFLAYIPPLYRPTQRNFGFISPVLCDFALVA